MEATASPSRLLRLAALAGLLSLVASPVSAQDAAADAGTPPPAGDAAANADASDCAECHEDTVNEHPKHQKFSCAECHPNVKTREHEDALSELGGAQLCAQSGCHGETAKKHEGGKHSDVDCESCHGFVHDEFTRFDVGSCKGCHGDQVKALATSVHAPTEKSRGARCAECHGDIHAVRLTTDPLAPMSKVMQPQTCGECHDDAYVKAFRDSVHGQGLLRSGLAVAPSCSTCHGGHDIHGVKTPESRMSRQNAANTCGECHTFILSNWRESTHGELWAKGDEKGPVCTTCHQGHKTVDPRIYGNHLKMADTCGECHESQSHSYRDSFHGKAARLGLQVAATCADCHTPHHMLPASNEKSSVHPANLEKTCENCHGDVPANFMEFEPHLDPTSPKDNTTVHWVWVFMTGLLVGTMGFFTVHTLLWLQRSIVAFGKNELRPPVWEGEKWVRRFRPVHIYIHLTIILTFLSLAATGLPIKFSNVEWARPVATIFGGLGGARLLHRIAGVVTFGYGVVFLVYLVREIIVRKRRELLFGWQSMIPNKKDAQDLWANIKWFLYLGPRPKLDRWAYWEKFDFFAVFWGIPVIGLSGLMLWFPKLAAEWLPGWALNIAYVIHSDEALLATGFIFFFHFFHTHLRPEAFPLDPVVFTGSMPLELFKHHRPAEYERLVASGELEKYLVAPPTERIMRRVHRFGFTALTLGIILGAFLLIAGLKAITN